MMVTVGVACFAVRTTSAMLAALPSFSSQRSPTPWFLLRSFVRPSFSLSVRASVRPSLHSSLRPCVCPPRLASPRPAVLPEPVHGPPGGADAAASDVHTRMSLFDKISHFIFNN